MKPLHSESAEKQERIRGLCDTDLSKLTDNQIAELTDFYMGSSELIGQSPEWAAAYAARAATCELECIRRLLTKR